MQTDYYYNGFETWLDAGTYTLDVQVSWVSVDVKDYTVSVQGPSAVNITDSRGKSNQTGGHDTTFSVDAAIASYQASVAAA